MDRTCHNFGPEQVDAGVVTSSASESEGVFHVALLILALLNPTCMILGGVGKWSL